MSKWKIEYRVVENMDEGGEGANGTSHFSSIRTVKQVKKTVTTLENAVPQDVLESLHLEYLTIRRVADKPAVKPAPEKKPIPEGVKK